MQTTAGPGSPCRPAQQSRGLLAALLKRQSLMCVSHQQAQLHMQGPSSRQLVQRLRDFTHMTRLQGLLLNVVARRLSGAEVASLQEAFQRLVCFQPIATVALCRPVASARGGRDSAVRKEMHLCTQQDCWECDCQASVRLGEWPWRPRFCALVAVTTGLGVGHGLSCTLRASQAQSGLRLLI